MKNALILLLVLFAFSSCQNTPEEKFENEGVSFISPEGWEIADEENLDDIGYYLSIEKDGMNSSGLIAITWLNKEIEVIDWMNIHKDEMNNNILYKNSDLIFEKELEGNFNDFNTTYLKYTLKLLGVKHEGAIHFFKAKGKTFSILIQEAIEDKASNKSGFELVEKSFKIE
ncbi:hypothetical protein H0I23_07135 [Cellulophaga sp. HaHaR_3_176]|uniref:hypothetical protein n=1 Tax=Cellulophaga sp. HaHaR_3_176 TaxID=1942464 RepID=UPI001C1F83A0|nr:hypothetical protein [Cellulophaga sp. HaHaR_3_176]QWX85408.1 hypothetical protein H0I23_07135 [Cellulophaga sp. HaHaR_3_176]